MQTLNDVHRQFAEFFIAESLRPYAYLVSKKLSEGHICINIKDIDPEDLPEPYNLRFTIHNSQFIKIDDKEKQLNNEPLVAGQNEEKQPFILHNSHLYLQRYFNYESMILNRIREFLLTEAGKKNERFALLKKHQKFIADLFDFKDGPNAANGSAGWQGVAAVSAALNNFTIITGGPGTGKTTTVAKILAILFTLEPNVKVALAAPTGKAASRIFESLKSAGSGADKKLVNQFQMLEPFTIQRLLKFSYGSPYCKHNRTNPLHYDVVIVDESSMVDVALFAKLLDAIGPDTRLILLGDKDQLASIEAGSLFGDLCQAQVKLNIFSNERIGAITSLVPGLKKMLIKENIPENNFHPLFEHVIELRYSHRYSNEKGIGKFSKAVLQNDTECITSFFENYDKQVWIDTGYSEKLFKDFIRGYEEFISEKDIHTTLKKLNKLRVLCAIREGEEGLRMINQKIEKYLSRKGIINITGAFYENRPIIITQNHYDLNLFNGDVGIIRPDENDGGKLKAWFENNEGGLKAFSPAYLNQCETVFAMTIHKSQGSEFDEVMIILPDADDIPILTRELLYTAVTRARSKVLIQGSKQVILHSANAFVKRMSGITERFKEIT